MGNAVVFYRVKKVKGRYYLVKEWYDATLKKKVTRSLGPCEEIERLVREGWCGGWDSNPRRPTPAGLKPRVRNRVLGAVSPVMGDVKVADPGKLEGFLRWCVEKGTSEETCRQYVGYLRKPLDRSNKWSVLAYKAYFRYVGDEESWKQLKTKQSKPDLNVPTDEEVVKTLGAAKNASEDLYLVYRLLVESGARLSEVIKMLREFDPNNLKDHGGFYTYALGYYRGSKQSFYVFSVTRPERRVISENWVSNWAAKNNQVNPKYVRKWVATKMAEIEIPMEVINFIQGRAPRSILERNYLNLYALALKYYRKYAEHLHTIGIVG